MVGSQYDLLVRRTQAVRREGVVHGGSELHLSRRAARFLERLFPTASDGSGIVDDVREPSATLLLPREGVAQSMREAKRPRLRGTAVESVRLRSHRGEPQGVSVKLEQVVGGGDQAPFGAGRGPASSFEAPDPSVGLDLAEDGLHHAQPS
jgi:hypothetical protein